MKQKTVLLIIDNPHRELRGAYSIVYSLKKRGIRGIISSKAGFENYYDYYLPEAVVFPRVTGGMAAFAERYSKQSRVCLIPVEHSAGAKDRVVMGLSGHSEALHYHEPSGIQYVHRVYLAGPQQRDWLVEDKVVTPEQSYVTGTLNSDHWFLGRSLDRHQTPFQLGISTTNKSLLYGSKLESIPYSLDEARNKGPWQKIVWRVDQMSLEASHTLLLTELIEHAQKAKIAVSVRPHPHEYVENWKFFQKNAVPGIELNRSLLLNDWLSKVSLTVSSFSTTALDSFAYGIPSISLGNIVPRRFIDGMPEGRRPIIAPYSWTPSTLEEVYDLIEKARRGVLPIAPDVEVGKRFLSDYFHFPRENLACEMIAEDLSKQTQLISKRPKPLLEPTRRPLKKVLQSFSWGRFFFMWAYQFRTYLTHVRRENLYFPFNLSQRAEANEYAKKLLSNHASSRSQ